ncbi:MAG: hypothetical protein U5L45_00460 [Saprospiraceae bacterium]|nr:hypothetical protein [Saprospiraceae bacterium]
MNRFSMCVILFLFASCQKDVGVVEPLKVGYQTATLSISNPSGGAGFS